MRLVATQPGGYSNKIEELIEQVNRGRIELSFQDLVRYMSEVII
jgi:hypothetical protein